MGTSLFRSRTFLVNLVSRSGLLMFPPSMTFVLVWFPRTVTVEKSFTFILILIAGYKNKDQYSKVPVELVVSHDYDLFDETLAKDFKLKPIETEFVQLEEVMHRIVGELNGLIQSEQIHRATNESTFSRVFYLSVLSIMFLVGLSLGQIVYMRNFFKQKKLI